MAQLDKEGFLLHLGDWSPQIASSLLILSAPGATQAPNSAYAFARAVLRRGHQLHRVFFYGEGVQLGNAQAVPAQDELNRQQRWAELGQQHDVELVLCVSSAIRRGVLDTTEAKRYDKAAANMHPAFTLAGLGELVDASYESDRLITFGG